MSATVKIPIAFLLTEATDSAISIKAHSSHIQENVDPVLRKEIEEVEGDAFKMLIQRFANRNKNPVRNVDVLIAHDRREQFYLDAFSEFGYVATQEDVAGTVMEKHISASTAATMKRKIIAEQQVLEWNALLRNHHGTIYDKQWHLMTITPDSVEINSVMRVSNLLRKMPESTPRLVQLTFVNIQVLSKGIKIELTLVNEPPLVIWGSLTGTLRIEFIGIVPTEIGVAIEESAEDGNVLNEDAINKMRLENNVQSVVSKRSDWSLRDMVELWRPEMARLRRTVYGKKINLYFENSTLRIYEPTSGFSLTVTGVKDTGKVQQEVYKEIVLNSVVFRRLADENVLVISGVGLPDLTVHFI